MISIHDRPDLHFLSHYDIRQRLDAEGQKSMIVIIDGDTAENHAVWFVLSTDESQGYTDAGFATIEYPGEVPLWKLHILTQHLPLELDYVDGGGKGIWEDLPDPYDSHDPQIPPEDMGMDFNKKIDAMSNNWYARVRITASPGEYEFRDDTETRQEGMNAPPYVVRLTPEAAKGAGLLSEWEPWEDYARQGWRNSLPDPGATIQFDVLYDFDSPKWAGWEAMTLQNATASGQSILNTGIQGAACRLQKMKSNGANLGLPLTRNGRMLNQSVVATA